MIQIEEVLAIHKKIIAEFGGGSGVRNYALLESAIQRPATTFDSIDLYPKTEDKISAIF